MHNNNGRIDKLRAAVDGISKPVYMTDLGQIADYYRDKGEKDWKSATARDLVGIAKNRKGEDMSYRNIRRRFEARGGKEGTGGSKKDIAALGQNLPATSHVPTQNTITVTVRGTVGGKYHSPVTATFSGSDAIAFVNEVYSPGSSGTGMNAYQMIWDDYGVDEDLFEDGDYELEVEGVSAS